MSLAAGDRLGPYEVVGLLGAGGMGEVCRARDSRLNRDVALKVLPEGVAGDRDRMVRFEREAQLLAALNHPHIAAIYGFEDDDGRRAIVMELIEGETLADRLAHGPLSIAEALPIARQIADALEYAHDRGVVHRDLKPANIKVTPDGSVKVLDFGLAKAVGDASDAPSELRGTLSPTLSLAATAAGVILGTAAYMAPEQAKGRGADRRADIWAFGLVLYEMLAGRRMFDGDSVAETLASVIKEPIAFAELPPATPPALRRLVRRCIERDVRRRLQSIGEARIVLDDVIGGVAEGETVAPAGVPASRRLPWLVAAATAVVVLAAGAAAWWSWPAASTPPVVRFTLPPPDGATLTGTFAAAPQLAVSPDGRSVAFIADEPGRPPALWVRALDALTAQRLERTEGARFPFWSPDSQHIGFFADGKLRRIAVAGGAPITICDAPAGEGGAWTVGADGGEVIVFAPAADGPLQRVLAKGGLPSSITRLQDGEASHSFPQFLDDSRFVYLARGGSSGIYVQAIGSDSRTRIVDSIGRAMFAAPDTLLYMRDNTLLAQVLDLDSMQLQGEPVTVADGIRSGGGNGRNAFSASANGVLMYRGGAAAGATDLRWYTREGKSDGAPLETGQLGQIALSPDDRRLAVQRGTTPTVDVWVKDLTSGVLSPVTTADGAELDPAWSSDGRRLAYVHETGDKHAYYVTQLGSGRHVALPGDFPRSSWLEGWTRDDTHLLVRELGTVRLLPVPATESATPAVMVERPVVELSWIIDQLQVSPDGRWVAYTSQESGQPQVNIASFPSFIERRQISRDGGVQPLWRADGRELFYVTPRSEILAISVDGDRDLTFGRPAVLLRTTMTPTPGAFYYAVTRDGQRFIVREPSGRDTNAIEPLYVVLNWRSLLAR